MSGRSSSSELRLPKLFTLRGDPFERADHESIDYGRWRIDRAFLFVPAQAYVAQWLQSLPRLPAAPEAGQLQPGPGHGDPDERPPGELVHLRRSAWAFLGAPGSSPASEATLERGAPSKGSSTVGLEEVH